MSDSILTPWQQQYIDSKMATLEEIKRFQNHNNPDEANNTVKTYRTYCIPYMEYCFTVLGRSPEDCDESDVRKFILDIEEDRDLSDRTVDLIISALRFLFQGVLDLPWNKYKVPMRKFIVHAPYVPDKKQVEIFISSIPDKKRRAMIVIMYACGLRISEVCRLHYGDIFQEERRLYVSASKNCCDRNVHIPDNCWKVILEYCRSLPKDVRKLLSRDSWLFPEQSNLNKHIYPAFVGDSLRKYEEMLGWEHRISCHTFRRAFATHNYIEHTMTIEEISHALGHRNISTTQIYLDLNMQYFQASAARKNSIDSMNL